MQRRNTLALLFIAALIGVSIWALAKPVHLGSFQREGIKLGLDLRGGTHLVYQANLSGVPSGERGARMEEAVFKIERRINAFGVSEPVIQTQGIPGRAEDRISVDLPGIKAVDEAVALIGKTAQLEFKKRTFDAQGNPIDTPMELTGKNLKRAFADTQQTPAGALQAVVSFELDEEGTPIFAEATREFVGTNNRIAVFLDDELLTAPTVNSAIEGGKGFIEGGFTFETARELATQLNIGALPVPLELIQREVVDESLGRDSLRKSVLAGELGLGVVLLFMVLYYRLPGVLASAALAVYALLVLATFKLLPVTLTLPGIAAFILSIGMAVDANILIFERMKEEVMGGRTLKAALGAGFARAWPSIRDSNVSTFITCAILYWFGSFSSEPRIMGFALTLAIGVAASMFTAIVVTRAFLGPVINSGLGRRLGLFTPARVQRGEA